MTPLIRSALTTFLASFLALIPLAPGDVKWVQPALIAAAITTLRTLVAYIDPGNTSYGLGGQHAETSPNGSTGAQDI